MRAEVREQLVDLLLEKPLSPASLLSGFLEAPLDLTRGFDGLERVVELEVAVEHGLAAEEEDGRRVGHVLANEVEAHEELTEHEEHLDGENAQLTGKADGRGDSQQEDASGREEREDGEGDEFGESGVDVAPVAVVNAEHLERQPHADRDERQVVGGKGVDPELDDGSGEEDGEEEPGEEEVEVEQDLEAQTRDERHFEDLGPFVPEGVGRCLGRFSGRAPLALPAGALPRAASRSLWPAALACASPAPSSLAST